MKSNKKSTKKEILKLLKDIKKFNPKTSFRAFFSDFKKRSKS